MKKTMFALTYCFEGVDDNCPYACTIAVSMDKEKLREKMMKCVEGGLHRTHRRGR